MRPFVRSFVVHRDKTNIPCHAIPCHDANRDVGGYTVRTKLKTMIWHSYYTWSVVVLCRVAHRSIDRSKCEFGNQDGFDSIILRRSFRSMVCVRASHTKRRMDDEDDNEDDTTTTTTTTTAIPTSPLCIASRARPRA